MHFLPDGGVSSRHISRNERERERKVSARLHRGSGAVPQDFSTRPQQQVRSTKIGSWTHTLKSFLQSSNFMNERKQKKHTLWQIVIFNGFRKSGNLLLGLPPF